MSATAGHTIELESRPCGFCGVIMRVLTTSLQRFHSKHCQQEFEKWGGPKNPLPDVERKTVSVSVNVTPRMSATERNISQEEGSPPFHQNMQKRNGRARKKDTTQTRSDLMQPGPSASESTAKKKTSSNVTAITPIAKPTQLKSAAGEIVDSPPALSGDSRMRLESAAFQSMSLLNKSAERLMDLIDECVSSNDLAKSKEGTQRVESHRIESAINAANALAHTMQTGTNLVKAMTDLLKASP